MKALWLALCLTVQWLLAFGTTQAQQSPQWITIYTDNFSGNYYQLGIGQYDHVYLVQSGIPVVYSVKVPEGLQVTLYKEDRFKGDHIVLTKDASTDFLKSKGFAEIGLTVSLIVSEKSIPTPDKLVTLYKDDYAGASITLGPGQYEFTDLGNIGNDNLSSLKVPKGFRVTLFEHSGFKGKSWTVSSDARAGIFVNNRFNDVTSSLIIEEIPETPKEPAPAPQQAPTVVIQQVVIVQDTTKVKPAPAPQPVVTAITKAEDDFVTIYQGDFSGPSKKLYGGWVRMDELGIGNDELSSIKIPQGFKVTLYEHDIFRGKSLVLRKDASAESLEEKGFNNTTSSLLIEKIPFVTIYQGDYSGASKKLEPGKYGSASLGIGNDELSSLRIPIGLQVTLYDKDSFEGRKLVLTHDTGADVLTHHNFNNITSSIAIEYIKEEEPTAPEVVTLFDGNMFGEGKELTVGKYAAEAMGLPDNALSSIKIPRGFHVTLYDQPDFQGRYLELRSDADAIVLTKNAFNNITSSIVVESIPAEELYVIVYTENFEGVQQRLLPGKYLARDLLVGDNSITSVDVPRGMQITLFDEDNFEGNKATLGRSVSLESPGMFDNVASSILVEDIFTPVTNYPVEEVIEEPPVPVTEPQPAPVPVTNQECVMTNAQYENAVKAVKGQNFRDEKMDMAKLATKGKCMSLSQIRGIAAQFMFEDQSLEFVKYAYDLSTEKSEYYTLSSIFKFMSSKEEFTNFLKSK